MSSAKKRKQRTVAKTLASSPSSTSRRCSICGRKLPAGSPAASCPVCLLRIALDPGNSGDELRGNVAKSAISLAEASPRRFGHYEILIRPDGSLHELGHGAMGITFKAIDLNLRIPVALKVLNLQLFQEELARRRFFREARSAASVRHPNVASVYHLGSREREIFYAMEFVEGETLENLIKSSGRVEPILALEIAGQVAAGLAAVHQQNLVHRDIKPNNIVVGLEERSVRVTKIIDLGLAKTINDPQSQTAISIPGAFAGTPGFASPEQFAALAVDIRSDLYSLGATLWMMLTGGAPFSGTPSEVMYQHLHSPLPLERLEGVPQPIVVLLEALLEKDPRRRLQSPAKLLEVMPIIVHAIHAGLPINSQNLRKLPEEQVAAHPKPVADLSAYDLYLRGMALMELLDPEANEKAGELFKKAVEQEPNFALGYTGLAYLFLEQEGFRGEKRLLDSAVESARRAIALDPGEVRSYTTLARAYNRKGWYSQCDEALRKALELEPNDDTANALAAIRSLSRHQFIEAYHLFLKAHVLNPKETWRTYYVTEILFRADMADLAERWMQRALDRETSPQLHHLMECYHAMWRHRFIEARVGFMQLPPETHLAARLQSTTYSVSDGLLYCAIGLEDWPAVVGTCNTQLENDPENFWARTYLALGLRLVGRPSEARQISEEVLKRGLERLERPAQPDIPWDVPLYVAWGYRFAGRQHEAYRYLGQYLAHRTLLHLPLGLDNPVLDEFKHDPEFNTILTDLKQKLELARRAIREHEAAVNQGIVSANGLAALRQN
jgi:serine/threonine protein kinase